MHPVRSNWKPIVVVIVGVVASCPLAYYAFQPINFYSSKGSKTPEMLFLGVLSLFFACVLVFRPFARLCARTPTHLPKAIHDTQVSLVVLGLCWRHLTKRWSERRTALRPHFR